MPKDQIKGSGCDGTEVIELVKCVYGLVDAPRHWWLSFSKVLCDLGMRQSELDPCTYHWFNGGVLQGLIALHVDDMIVGGTDQFHEQVLSRLKQRFPFKHWHVGSGKFLGRMLKQQEDGSIVIDQTDYANTVESIKISKDRRR